ncbi:MAG: hypothetical protein JWL88_807 [Parcubacteria group bacterium]|nr:hypothetical protein [Parcubacteria group bacterium]
MDWFFESSAAEHRNTIMVMSLLGVLISLPAFVMCWLKHKDVLARYFAIALVMTNLIFWFSWQPTPQISEDMNIQTTTNPEPVACPDSPCTKT